MQTEQDRVLYIRMAPRGWGFCPKPFPISVSGSPPDGLNCAAWYPAYAQLVEKAISNRKADPGSVKEKLQ